MSSLITGHSSNKERALLLVLILFKKYDAQPYLCPSDSSQ